MSKFKFPAKFTKNNNKTVTPQSYIDNEVVIFKGEYKGYEYSITKNDFARREITGTLALVQNPTILFEILQMHYSSNNGAGIPSFADEYTIIEA